METPVEVNTASPESDRAAQLLADVRAAWAAMRTAPEVARLQDRLAELGAIIVFGGFPRRIARKRWDTHDRDIDVVVDTARLDDLEVVCADHTVRRNRFGGFALRVGGIPFDVWALGEMWAFRHHVCSGDATPATLPRTVFQSSDALAVDLTRGQVHEAGFWRTEDTRTLEVVCTATPVPSLCAVRLVVTAVEDDLKLGTIAREFLHIQLGRALTWPRVRDIQLDHYGQSRITEAQWIAALAANEIAPADPT